MTRNNEQNGDRQMVMRNIRQPQRLSLRMEATQERENRSSSALRGAKNVVRGIWVLSVYTPQLPVKNGSQTFRVRLHREEVVPTHVYTPRFGNCNVNHVPRPSQRANAEQTSQVVVEARLSILKPRQAGAELGLKVQPTCKQDDCCQEQQRKTSLGRVQHLCASQWVYHQW